ncbi:MAG: hypothetical protein QNL77_07205 [Akkermansiaceae bacterium]
MKFYAAIAAVLILCGQLLAQEKIPEPAKEAFAVEVKKFGRPILWLKPKADSNGVLPVKVLTDFLEKVSEGDLENAQKMCYIAGGSSKDERPTVTDNEFKLFISQFQDSELTRIVLSHYAIRGKSGYVSVGSKTTRGGQVTRQKWHFSLKRIKGVWKVGTIGR